MRLDDPSSDVAVLLLLASLAMVVVAQGGFSGPVRWAAGSVLAIAALTAVGWRRDAVRQGLRGPTGPLLGIGLWALARSISAGEVRSGIAVLTLLVGIAFVVAVVTGAGDDHRQMISESLVVIGVAVALAGWAGVVLRLRPWAVTGESTWRAASTFTYPNAAGALLVSISLLAIARRTAQPRSPGRAAVASALLVGLVLTQSRGAALALLAGLLVLTIAIGPAQVADAVTGPAIGAALASGAVLASVSTVDPAKPLVAVTGTAVGLTIAAGSARLSARRLRQTGVFALVAAVTALVVLFRSDALGADRLSLGSADRVMATDRAIDVIARRPLVGVGPGRLALIWDTPDAIVGVRLVHNEYLQLLAELGVIGGVALVFLIAAVARSIRRAHHRSDIVMWSASAAALVAFAVHSAFDFLWHIPALPLVMACMYGLAVTPATSPSPTTTEGENDETST